jgi:lysine/ornithine N-monooxygenase
MFCTIKTGFVTCRTDGTAWCVHRSLHDARTFASTTDGHIRLEIRIEGWNTMCEYYVDGAILVTGYKEGQP